MKETIIIITILMIIFGGALYTQKYLTNTADTLVSKLENLKTDLESENTNQQRLEGQSDEIYGEWEEINEKWSVVVLHDEIDLIETSLIRMKSKIKTGSLEESMEDLDTSIFLLKHIKEKEKTSLKNIF
ncbi:MAG: DUF4363 family protein [Clostridia bacterium]|nr:DUF4363 family protein [Clostridia bacterium]